MATSSSDTETFVRTIGEREIEFRPPTDAQMLVIGRMMKVVQGIDENDITQVTGSVQKVSRVLDIIDSMVVDPADRGWLEDQIVAGKLVMNQLTEVFDVEPATNRAGRRAAAKKTTSRARKS
jgi:uncharacterized protein YacL